MDDDEEIFLPPTLGDDEETQAPSLRFAEADVYELASRREYGSRPGSSRISGRSLGNAGIRANENGKKLQKERELGTTDKARRVALARHEEKQAREAMIALYASIPHDFSLLMRSGDMGGSLKDTNPQLLRTSTHYGNNSSIVENKDNKKGRLVDALAREKTVVRAAFDSLLCQYSLREQNNAASGDTRSGSVNVDPFPSAANISNNVAKDSSDRPSEAVECLVAEARRFISALCASTAVGSTSTDEPETSRSENACSGALLGEEGSDRDRRGQEEEQKHDAPIGRCEMAPPRELARHVSVCHNNSNTSIVQRSLARLHLTLLVNEGLKAQLNEALDEHRADLRNTQDVRGTQTHNGRVLARVSNTKQTRDNSDDEGNEQHGDDDSTKTSTCIVSSSRRVIRPRAKDMVMRQILTRIGISGGRKDEEAPRAGQLFPMIRKSSASSGNRGTCAEDQKESCERTKANRWLPDGIHTLRSATAKTMLLRNSASTLDRRSSCSADVGNSDDGGNRRGQDEKATAATSYDYERRPFSLVCFPLLKRKSEIEKSEELFKKDFGILESFTNCLPPPLVTGDPPIDAAHWNATRELTKSATKQQQLRMMMMEKPLWSTNSTAESSSLSLSLSSWPFSSSSSSLHIIIDDDEEAELREIIGSAAVDFLLMRRSSSCSSSDSICGDHGADANVGCVGCCADDDRLIMYAALAHLLQPQRLHGGGEGKGKEIATLRDLHFALGGRSGGDGNSIRSKLGYLLKQHIGDTLRWATLKGKLHHSHAAHKKSTVTTTRSTNSDGAASSVQAVVRSDIQSSSTNGRGSAASVPFTIDKTLLIPPSEEDTLLPPPSLRYLRFERSYHHSTTAKSSISTNREGRRSIGVNTKLSTTVGMRTFAPHSEYHVYHDADGQGQLQPTATAIRREFTDLAPLINNFLMPAQFPVGPQEARHRRVCEMIAARGATCFVLPFPITTDEGDENENEAGENDKGNAGSSSSDGDSDSDNSRDDDNDANEEEDQFSAYASSFDDDGDGDDWIDAEMEEEEDYQRVGATINKSPPSIAATIQQQQRLLIGKKGEEESSPAALRLGLEEGKRRRLFGYASPKIGDLEAILRQVSKHKRRKGQEGKGGKHPNDRDGDDLPISDILQLQEKLGDVYLKSPFLTRNQWRVLRHVVRYEGFMSLHTVPDPQALIDEEEEEEEKRKARLIDSEYADDDDERGVDKQSWKERNNNKTARKKKKAFAELLSRLVLNREPPLSGRVISPSLAAASISDLSSPSVAHSHSSKKKSKDATTKRWTSGEEPPAPIFMSRPKSSFVKEWYNRRRRNGSNKKEDERRGVQPNINSNDSGNGNGGVGYGAEQTKEEAAKGGSYNGGHGGAVAGHHDERTNIPAASSASVVAVDATDARHCQNDEGAFFQQPSVRCLYSSEVEALHAMGTAGGACPTTSATVLADLIPELGSYLCSQQIGNTDEATTAENEGRQHTINGNNHTRQHPSYNLSMYSSTASSFAGRQLSYNRPSGLRYLPSYHQHTPQTPIGLTKNTYGHPFQMSALFSHDLLDASLLLRRNLRMLGLGPKKAEGVEKTATKKQKQKSPSVEAEEEKEEDRCRRLALGDAVDGGHVDRGVISVNASHVTIRLTGVKTTATTRTSTEKGASALSSAPNSSAKGGGARRDASGGNNRVGGGGGGGVSELTIPLCEIVEVVLGHSVGFLPTIRNAARCARRRAAELLDREGNGAAPLADSSDTASPYESAIRRLYEKGFSKEVSNTSEEETSTPEMIRGGMSGELFGIDSNAMRADGGQYPCDSIRGLTDRYYQCLTIVYAPAAHQQRARIAEYFDPNLLNNSNNTNNRNRRNNNQQEKQQQQQYPSRGAKHDGRMLFSGDAAAGDLIGDYIPLRESYVSVIIDSKSQWNAILTALMNSEVTITPNPSSAVHVSNVLLAHSSGSSSPTGATATAAAAGGRGAMGGLSAPSTTSSSASSSAYSGAIKRAIPIRFAGALPLSQLISNITATSTEEVTDRDKKSRKEGTRSSPETSSTKSELLQKSAEENRAALAALKSDELAFCECFHINPIVYGKAKKHVLSRHCRPLKSFDSLTAVIDLDFFRLQQIVSFFESKGWVRLHTVYRNQKVKALH